MPNPTNNYKYYITYTTNEIWYRFIDEDVTGSTYIPVTIITQPISQTIIDGQEVTFTCLATGSETPFTYQWYKDGVALSTGSTLTFTVTPLDAGDYKCVVTDATTLSVTSDIATLTVREKSGIIDGGEDTALQAYGILDGGEDDALQSYGILDGNG